MEAIAASTEHMPHEGMGKEVWAYVALAFGLSWAAVLPGIRLRLSEPFLTFGAAGPAIAAMILSRRRASDPGQSRAARWTCFVALTAVAWTVLSLYYSLRINPGTGLRFDPLFLVPAAVPAWVISSVFAPDKSVRALLRRLVHVPDRWSLIAVLIWPVFLLLPAGFAHAFGAKLVWPHRTGSLPTFIATAVVFFAFNLLFTAAMEEPGWRGFLLDRLQTRFSPFFATLLVWLPWMLWHADVDWFRPVRFPLVVWIQLRIVTMIPLCIILTWLYNRSRRSIQAVALFHAGMNTFPFIVPYFTPGWGLLFVGAGYVVIADRMWRRKNAKVEN